MRKLVGSLVHSGLESERHAVWLLFYVQFYSAKKGRDRRREATIQALVQAILPHTYTRERSFAFFLFYCERRKDGVKAQFVFKVMLMPVFIDQGHVHARHTIRLSSP